MGCCTKIQKEIKNYQGHIFKKDSDSAFTGHKYGCEEARNVVFGGKKQIRTRKFLQSTWYVKNFIISKIKFLTVLLALKNYSQQNTALKSDMLLKNNIQYTGIMENVSLNISFRPEKKN